MKLLSNEEKKFISFLKKADQVLQTGLNRIESLTKKFGRFVDTAKLVMKFRNSIKIEGALKELEAFKYEYLQKIRELDLTEQEIFKRKIVLENIGRIFMIDYIMKKEPKFYEEVLQTLSKYATSKIKEKYPDIENDIDIVKEAKNIVQEYSVLTGEVATIITEAFGRKIITKVSEASREYVNKERFYQLLEEKVDGLFRSVNSFNNMAEVDIKLLTQSIVQSVKESEKEATEKTTYLQLRHGDTFEERRRRLKRFNEFIDVTKLPIINDIASFINFVKLIHSIAEQTMAIDLDAVRRNVDNVYKSYLMLDQVLREVQKQKASIDKVANDLGIRF